MDPQNDPDPLELKAPGVLLEGAPGSGKTTALATLLNCGLEVFAVITEPGGEESLLDGVRLYKAPIDRLHWTYIAPATAPWSALTKMAERINSMGYEDLSKLKSGIDKDAYRQFFQLLGALSNFKCARTGKEYGAVDDFRGDECVVLDSLSGINRMAFQLTVGGKPTAHQGEWGVAMAAEESLIAKLCSDIKVPMILTAHVEPEKDEVDGSIKLMPMALGRRLAPKLPKDFSDVVYSYREGSDFFWSTIATKVDVKTRNLPRKDKLPPNFAPVIEAWRRRVEQAKGGSE